MKRALAFALALPLAAADWTPTDTKWEVAWQLVNLADWSQTRQFAGKATYSETWDQANSCWQWKETHVSEVNPILGRNPSRSEINTYFVAGALLHYGVSRILAEHRRTFQAVTLGFSLACVAQNEWRCGVHVKF